MRNKKFYLVLSGRIEGVFDTLESARVKGEETSQRLRKGKGVYSLQILDDNNIGNNIITSYHYGNDAARNNSPIYTNEVMS